MKLLILTFTILSYSLTFAGEAKYLVNGLYIPDADVCSEVVFVERSNQLNEDNSPVGGNVLWSVTTDNPKLNGRCYSVGQQETYHWSSKQNIYKANGASIKILSHYSFELTASDGVKFVFKRFTK